MLLSDGKSSHARLTSAVNPGTRDQAPSLSRAMILSMAATWHHHILFSVLLDKSRDSAVRSYLVSHALFRLCRCVHSLHAEGLQLFEQLVHAVVELIRQRGKHLLYDALLVLGTPRSPRNRFSYIFSQAERAQHPVQLVQAFGDGAPSGTPVQTVWQNLMDPSNK